jgi:hypothetical protein
MYLHLKGEEGRLRDSPKRADSSAAGRGRRIQPLRSPRRPPRSAHPAPQHVGLLRAQRHADSDFVRALRAAHLIWTARLGHFYIRGPVTGLLVMRKGDGLRASHLVYQKQASYVAVRQAKKYSQRQGIPTFWKCKSNLVGIQDGYRVFTLPLVLPLLLSM